MSERRHCLWGYRRGYIQVGSAEDRYRQGLARVIVGCVTMLEAFGRALQPGIKEAARAIAELGRVLSSPPPMT